MVEKYINIRSNGLLDYYIQLFRTKFPNFKKQSYGNIVNYAMQKSLNDENLKNTLIFHYNEIKNKKEMLNVENFYSKNKMFKIKLNVELFDLLEDYFKERLTSIKIELCIVSCLCAIIYEFNNDKDVSNIISLLSKLEISLEDSNNLSNSEKNKIIKRLQAIIDNLH